MEIKIHSKGIELNPRAETYIQKKFSRLERHLKSISDAKLEVSRTSARSQNDRVIVQMTLTAGGRILRGQETGLNLFAAVDAVTDVMDRQIETYKGKAYRSSQSKKSARTDAAGLMAAEVSREPDSGPVGELGRPVRTKRFTMQPMTVEDAALEMELLSHDFFFFFNQDTGEYNVVYRRRDGDYGVIEPELE